MTNPKIAGIPNVTPGIPDSPGKLNPFMRVPETARPTARHIKDSAWHHQTGLTDVENLTRLIGCALVEARYPAGRINTVGIRIRDSWLQQSHLWVEPKSTYGGCQKVVVEEPGIVV